MRMFEILALKMKVIFYRPSYEVTLKGENIETVYATRMPSFEVSVLNNFLIYSVLICAIDSINLNNASTLASPPHYNTVLHFPHSVTLESTYSRQCINK